jgi:hypothetical protein
MEPKFDTLRAIYEMISETADPTKTLLASNELILHQARPWDEVVEHLNDLNKDGYILLQQLSVAVISMTSKGMDVMRLEQPHQTGLLRNLKYSK